MLDLKNWPFVLVLLAGEHLAHDVDGLLVNRHRLHLVDVVLQVLDADLAHADAHDKAAVGQLVDAGAFRGLDGGVAHVGRGDARGRW